MSFLAKDLSALSRKYLPPGTVFETFQFYSGWCAAHNIEKQASRLDFSPLFQLGRIDIRQLPTHAISLWGGRGLQALWSGRPLLAHALRYGTFLRRWNQHWTCVLKFRDRSYFSQCDICQELKSQLLSFEILEYIFLGFI